MIGAIFLALGTAGLVKQTIHEDIMSYEFREMQISSPGDVYCIGNGVNRRCFLKKGNIEVDVGVNCFGDQVAYGAVNTMYYGNYYGPVNAPDCMIPDKTYRKLTIDKETGVRMVMWDGVYFDADTSSPIRAVNDECNYDLKKIWIANEVLKDRIGISFWQFATGEIEIDDKDLQENLVLRVLPNIDLTKQENTDYVAFRELCRNSCIINKKLNQLTLYLEHHMHVADTTYSSDEYKRRKLTENDYRPIR